MSFLRKLVSRKFNHKVYRHVTVLLTSYSYNRILTRIQETASESRWKEVQMVLGWLVVAKRPLKWSEIQCLKALNLNKSSIEYDRKKFLLAPKDLFDSLVDWRDDGTVQLVHLSAK
jgi:hypothetical protein